MKYVLLAIFFLVAGYAVSFFFSPSDLGLDKAIDYGQTVYEELPWVEKKLPPEANQKEAPQLNSVYPEGSYLTESDLLSIPGTTKPLGFRVGPPVSSNKADALIERLTDELTLSKARYMTGNSKKAVIVLANSYDDYFAASKDWRILQPSIKETLEIIYLPACAQAGSQDDEGYICGPPPEENGSN